MSDEVESHICKCCGADLQLPCECRGTNLQSLHFHRRFCSRCFDARVRFRSHIRGAVQRGIPFLMTFEQWWSIWQQSGNWHERGRGNGKYVMARFADRGPYAVGNVKIILWEENNAEREFGYEWVDEQVALLKKLWADGVLTSQIAAQLGGISLNAVVGKVRQLGLKRSRPSANGHIGIFKTHSGAFFVYISPHHNFGRYSTLGAAAARKVAEQQCLLRQGGRMPKIIKWTDEQESLLRKLWADGFSANQIAAELGGVTRNAVIGKVHRMGCKRQVKDVTLPLAYAASKEALQ
jgi:hypothetical protein